MEREEFLEHYLEIQRPLRAYLLGATGCLHETDDLSQVVWQVLWKKLDEFDERRSFKAWSFGIARLEVLKWRQRKARSREVGGTGLGLAIAKHACHVLSGQLTVESEPGAGSTFRVSLPLAD